MRIIPTLGLALILATLTASPSSAQQSAGPEAGLTPTSDAVRALLVGHESATDRQRSELDALLAREDVENLARDRGLDMERVRTAAAALSDARVGELSSLLDAVPQDDGGGLGSITIGVGALIVVLLILILLS